MLRLSQSYRHEQAKQNLSQYFPRAEIHVPRRLRANHAIQRIEVSRHARSLLRRVVEASGLTNICRKSLFPNSKPKTTPKFSSTDAKTCRCSSAAAVEFRRIPRKQTSNQLGMPFAKRLKNIIYSRFCEAKHQSSKIENSNSVPSQLPMCKWTKRSILHGRRR